MLFNRNLAQDIKKKLDEKLLGADGRILLQPAAFYQNINPNELIIWCSQSAIYTVPTTELVNWLKLQIGDRSAIEVGAGNGSLGWYLDIPATDSYCQQSAVMQILYSSNGAAVTKPGAEVERLDAEQAVLNYQPDVVIASWLTQKWLTDADTQASILGADEATILANTKTYIHVGNSESHGTKRILSSAHSVYKPDWLITRSANQLANVIYTWNK